MLKFKIGKKIISNNHPTYFIADIAANHDGDLKKAKKLIYLCAEAGADAAKFQHFSAGTIVSDYGFKSLKEKKSHQKTWKKSVFEVYKDASINLSWTLELKKTCKKAGIDFFSSPYSFEMVDHLEPYVPAYKIGSGDITWLSIIKHIAKKNRPVILASGASNLTEVKNAIKTIQKYNKKIVLMQCNTNYTASLENLKFINLRVLEKYKEYFPNVILGLSDHTHGHSTVLGSVALGARVIEKHFTINKKMTGNDHYHSMDIKDLKKFKDELDYLQTIVGKKEKTFLKSEKKSRKFARRSIVAKNFIKKNQLIKLSDLICKRPGTGLEPAKLSLIIGKKAKRNLVEDQIITKKDIN